MRLWSSKVGRQLSELSGDSVTVTDPKRALENEEGVNPRTPRDGLGVLHLFCKPKTGFDKEAFLAACKGFKEEGLILVTFGVLGHKADLGVMAVAGDFLRLRSLQSEIQRSGLEVVDSYVSITEVSEYAAKVPEDQKRLRLYPKRLPPKGSSTICFYPMSKRRNVDQNWYQLPYEERERLMFDHGASGRKFAGRIVQLVTGSAGVDDWEWGVTLFAERPDDLKAVVYTMRYDEASAVYAEFGKFYMGVLLEPEELAEQIVR